MTVARRRPYASGMSPRVNRDVRAIEVVEISADALGRGLEQEGGGQLQGGLVLMNRFTAQIADPEVPYAITMTIAARDGRLACESITVAAMPSGPAVGSGPIRGIALSIYLQRIRQELGDAWGGGLITKPVARTEHAVAYQPLTTPEDWEKLDYAQARRAIHTSKITPQMAATAYRDALASPDPDKNRRPTAAAADALGASRGHVSRLLTEARRLGIPGLGPSRPARAKTGEGRPEQ